MIIGYDARRKSDAFALDTARVLRGPGRARDAVRPRRADAGAGVEHHRGRRGRRRDGHRLAQPAGGQRLQGLPRHRRADRPAGRHPDRRVHRRRRPVRGRAGRRRRSADRAASARALVERLPRRRAGGAPACPSCPACRWPTPRCTASAATRCWPRSTAPAGRRRTSSPRSRSRTARSRRCRSPTRRSRGRWTCCSRSRPSATSRIAIANDPDADRLGAAIPQPDGSWRRLYGDEIGWLLADHILRHTTGDDRFVITTLVSSSLLGRMAAGARRALRRDLHRVQVDRAHRARAPRVRFVLGYEQALGYLVCGRPLDKDGITAAVLLAEVAALAAAEGVTLQERLDALAATLRPPRDGRAVVADATTRRGGARRRAARQPAGRGRRPRR